MSTSLVVDTNVFVSAGELFGSHVGGRAPDFIILAFATRSAQNTSETEIHDKRLAKTVWAIGGKTEHTKNGTQKH